MADPATLAGGLPGRADPLRRVPVQGRSLARVNRMLDACASLLDEIGYEAFTTTLVAERARVAIGSLYQYFPDKRAIVQALATRNLEAYLARMRERVAAGDLADWRGAADAAIDEFADLHRTTPGFRTLRFGDLVDRHLLEPERDNDTVIADELSLLLVSHFGLADSPELRFALLIAGELGGALVTLAFRRQADGDPVILAEVRLVVRDYLDHRLTRPSLRDMRAP